MSLQLKTNAVEEGELSYFTFFRISSAYHTDSIIRTSKHTGTVYQCWKVLLNCVMVTSLTGGNKMVDGTPFLIGCM